MTGQRGRLSIAVLATTLVFATTSLVATSANASEARIVVAGAANVPSTDTILNQGITTSFDLQLTQQHASSLQGFIASLTNTSSANYHHFLSPAQYARRFGECEYRSRRSRLHGELRAARWLAQRQSRLVTPKREHRSDRARLRHPSRDRANLGWLGRAIRA